MLIELQTGLSQNLWRIYFQIGLDGRLSGQDARWTEEEPAQPQASVSAVGDPGTGDVWQGEAGSGEIHRQKGELRQSL